MTEIAVYLSKRFCNEESELFKVSSVSDEKIYKKNSHGEEVLVERTKYNLDYSTKTSLSKLYKDGWRIKTANDIQPLWMLFFMERD